MRGRKKPALKRVPNFGKTRLKMSAVKKVFVEYQGIARSKFGCGSRALPLYLLHHSEGDGLATKRWINGKDVLAPAGNQLKTGCRKRAATGR